MIYLHEPSLKLAEKKNIDKCIKNNQISSIGSFIKKFENEISRYTNTKFTISCSSGTAALHVALKVLGVNKKCEVIVPTITFIATVNAIRYNLADPVFVDNDDFFNIDENKTLEFLKKKTFQKKGMCINRKSGKQIKAIIITHMYGNAAKFEKLYKTLKKKNIKIVEDAAESFGTKYKSGYFKDRHTGSTGDIGCFSFNGNKIITTGNGGALITNNKNFAKKLRYYVNQSKENSIEYIHNEVGFNYRMTNLSAALGYGQILRMNKVLKKKEIIFKTYSNLFKIKSKLHLSSVPKYGRNNYWLNICKFKNFENKNLNKVKNIIKKFRKKNIEIRPIWKPCHLQKQFKNSEFFKIKNALKLYYNSFCLPSGQNLSKKSIKEIVECLHKFEK